jgi:hypothetical protein
MRRCLTSAFFGSGFLPCRHASSPPAQASWMDDRGIRQTSTATPAEPGDLPWELAPPGPFDPRPVWHRCGAVMGLPLSRAASGALYPQPFVKRSLAYQARQPNPSWTDSDRRSITSRAISTADRRGDESNRTHVEGRLRICDVF